MLPSAKWRKVPADEVWLDDDGKLIVLGDPPEMPDELGHNCDAMGCGWCHVLVRAKSEIDSGDLYTALPSNTRVQADAVGSR